MKYIADIRVMPLKALLDPQGKAVGARLQTMGLKQIENVRIGKRITLEVEAAAEKKAAEIVDKACKELLHNPIMESYEFSIKKSE